MRCPMILSGTKLKNIVKTPLKDNFIKIEQLHNNPVIALCVNR